MILISGASGFIPGFQQSRSAWGALRTLLLCAVVAGSLAAQSYQGGVRGTVADAQGGVVPNVKVSLINEGTGLIRTTLSNDAGAYDFPTVAPAVYSLKAEGANFKSLERKNVTVGTQEFLTVDLRLEVGSVSENVLVTEEVPLIENANASNGQVLDTQKLTDLPNLGRNPFLLSKLTANVTPVGDPRFNRFQDQSGSSQISIAGGPVRGNNYLIDGVPITDSVNRAVIIPSIEATQEMKLQMNTYDAEMGRTGGGVFNNFLKSGTNSLHGSLFGYTRQTDWLANNFFFNKSGAPRPDTPFYNWGASVGGPIWIPKVYNGKNKTFFWLSTESYRQKSPQSDQYLVPTALERTGNFSQSAVKIFDPLTSRPCAAGDNCPAGVSVIRSQFPGNIIPPTRLNPVGQAILSYLPLPNEAVSGFNYAGFNTLTDRADEYTAKADHQIFSWWNVNASYLHYKSREPGGNSLGTLAASSSGSPYLLFRKVDATQVNSIMTPNPTTVVSLRYGFNRFPNVTSPINLGFNPSSLGLPANYTGAIQAQYFPEVDFTNFSLSNVSPSNTVFYSKNLLGSVSKFMGRHSLKLGADYRLIHTDFLSLSNSAGLFAFNGVFTRQFPSVVTAGTGQDYADALLGNPSSGNVNTSTKFYTSVRYYSGYFQDDIRVSNKLTVNAGIRYEYETGISEKNNHYVVGFDRNAINPLANLGVTGIVPAGAVQYAGVNGNPTACCGPSSTKFGPRIGAAYQLFRKTTLRGGWGIFYAPTRFADDASLAVGYTQTTSYVASNDGNATPANSLSNPFPNGISQPVGNIRGGLAGVGSSFNYLDQNRSSGIVYQYSADIQQELPGKIALEVGYIGSASRHLQTSSTSTGALLINQVPSNFLALGSALAQPVANPFYQHGGTGIIGGATVTQAQLLRPFPEFGNIGVLTNKSKARYDSMVIKAQKRLSSGLTFLSAFTWSKNMDNELSTNFFSGAASAVQDYYNLQNEYSLAIANTPLRWSTSVSYDLPFGKGRRFANSSRLLDYAVGGWQINTVIIYQTGFPLPIYQVNSNSVIGAGAQRPNATGISPEVSGSVESRLNGYINPAAFSTAPTYTFGNVARTIPYYGPGTKNWDASLFKSFTFGERYRAQFRAEALNAFNTPQFPLPNTQFGTSSFGKITSQVNFARLLQLGVRFQF